ncbi:TorF family putative porin [Hansschlegelia sp. KR7-227]|uniref:TorF family putative porin n=1 Tax=Hansschlegelia sp. KR7-227 TaxID=3400914 RepID=UPI003C11F76D
MRTGLAALAVAAAAGSAAEAADFVEPPAGSVPSLSNIDVAFGLTLASQYVARGLAQSDGDPGIQAYGEARFFDLLYAGAWAASLKLPESKGLTDPALEVDAYIGMRRSWDRLTLDGGVIYFWYAGETGRNTDYWEPYFKPSYQLNDWLTIGALLRATNNFVNLGGKEAYLLGSAKIKLPNLTTNSDLGFYLSGDFGHRWIGKTDAGFNFPDYYVWNAGVGAAYKAMTLDLRYWDTTLSRRECGLLLNDRGWCGDRYLVSLSFDTALSKLK